MIMKIRSSRGAAQRLCWVTQFAWWGFLQHYRTLIPLLLQKGGWQALHSVRQPPLLKLDCIMRMALSSSYSFLYSFLNGMHFLFSFYSILLETFLIAWHRISLISDCSQWTPCILCCHNEVKVFIILHYNFYILSIFCKILLINNLRGPRKESPELWQIYEYWFQKGLWPIVLLTFINGIEF